MLIVQGVKGRLHYRRFFLEGSKWVAFGLDFAVYTRFDDLCTLHNNCAVGGKDGN